MIDPATAAKLGGAEKFAFKASGAEGATEASKFAGKFLPAAEVHEIQAKAAKLGADPQIALKAAKNGTTIYNEALKGTTYQGKSMAPGGGGRFEALVDTHMFAGKTRYEAERLAEQAGVKKYGATQMDNFKKPVPTPAR